MTAMAKVRMYGLNNGKFLAEHTSTRREEMRFRKQQSLKHQQADNGGKEHKTKKVGM